MARRTWAVRANETGPEAALYDTLQRTLGSFRQAVRLSLAANEVLAGWWVAEALRRKFPSPRG
jgi:hypothetical protein